MSDGLSIPTANLLQTSEFLKAILVGGPEHLATLSDASGLIVRTVEPDAIDDGVRAMAKVQGTHNCYFHANPLRSGVTNKKGRRDDVVSIRMLHVDVDDLEALPRILAYPLRPSVVIATGGGFQSLYLLKEGTTDFARAEAMNKRIAADLGGDSCHSIDHLLRLPGTINALNAKKRAAGRVPVRATLVSEATDFTRRYTLEECERALGIGYSLAAPSVWEGAPASIVLHTADTLPIEIPERTSVLITEGKDPKYPSRSEVVLRVALDLAKAGADEGIIAGVLMNPANGVAASILERRDSERYALRQARRALLMIGEAWPDVGRKGQPIASFHNALVGLTRLGLHFVNDEFRNRKWVSGHQMQELTGELTDDVCAALRHAFLRRFGFDPTKEHIRDAANTLCLENTVHPVREYLDSLRWDGIPRINKWLSTYMGAEDSALNAAIGRLVLTAAVRRVREPGAKFDTIMVLEGPQGTGKSSALSLLAGEAFFSDQEILTLDAKAQSEAVEGIWIYELGELQGLNRTDTDRVKAFASRSVDRVRPAYARFREDHRRQTVFIGTTNDDQYLRDPTGNRRFWPVATGAIDLENLRRDRDQIWAEAAQVEAQGGSLVLPEELWPAARNAQAARLLDDPWLDALARVRGTVEGGFARISTADVLTHLEIPGERKTPASAKRVVPLMRSLGWDGPKSMRIRKWMGRGYERPKDAPDDPEIDEPFGRGGMPAPE